MSQRGFTYQRKPTEAVEALCAMPYRDYLSTDYWKAKRRYALLAADYHCQVCYGTQNLEVHHRTYERLGDELLKDLTVLCCQCHRIFHAGGRMPQPPDVSRVSAYPTEASKAKVGYKRGE